MEFKRIFLQKKLIIALLVLFAANIFLFFNSQTESTMMVNEFGSLESALQYWDGVQENAAKRFYENLDKVSEEKDNMLSINIFSKPDSFSYKNIIKTDEDFKNIKNVKLKPVRDKAVLAFFDYGEIYIIGFAAVILLVVTFFDERKNGLWQIIHSCRCGRFLFAARRIRILFLFSAAVSVLLTGAAFISAFGVYGGVSVLGEPVQAVTALQKLVVNISVFEFIVYYVLMYALALFVNGIAVWLILMAFRNKNFGMLFGVMVYAVEFLFYKTIRPTNPLSFLRYFNLFSFLNVKDMFTEYTNFSFFGMLFNVREFLTAVLILLPVLSGAVVIFIAGRKKPFSKIFVLEVLFEKAGDRFRSLMSRLNAAGYEFYKYIIQQRGIIIFFVFTFIVISGINTEEILFSPGKEVLNEFYLEHTGVIDEDMVQLYEKIEDDLERIEEEEQMVFEAERYQLDILNGQLERAERLSERGIDGWFINANGFMWHLDKRTFIRRLLNGIIAVITLILLLAPVYATENQSGVRNIIRCTRYGRNRLFARKSAYMFLCVFAVSAVIFGAELYETLLNFSFKGIFAPVQNIDMLEEFPLKINIFTYLIGWYFARIAVLSAVSAGVMCISVFNVRIERAYVLALITIPFGVFACGLTDFKSIALICAAGVLCTIILLYVVYRKWNERI